MVNNIDHDVTHRAERRGQRHTARTGILFEERLQHWFLDAGRENQSPFHRTDALSARREATDLSRDRNKKSGMFGSVTIQDVVALISGGVVSKTYVVKAG